jgi:hypothetical protein
MRPIFFALALLLGVGSPLAAQTLGSIDFPNSGSPSAQAPFLRGVLLLHNFEYADAAKAFREAQGADSAFALAYWGEAMTYTHPLWNEQDLPAARAALLRLGGDAVSRLGKTASPRERLYLETMERVFGGTDKIILDSSGQAGGGSVVPYLPLNELRTRPSTPSTPTQPPGVNR